MASDKITVSNILLPTLLLSLTLAISIGFQTVLLVKDRDVLQDARTHQDQPLNEIEKVKTQANALASGVLKLAQQGDKDAQAIILQLKQAGVQVGDQPQQPPAAPASTPAVK